MTVLQSPLSVGETVQKLTLTMKEKNLSIFSVINHDENALKAGTELKPTKLIIFGNPQVGSKLMAADRRVGVDLPMKLLIWEDQNGKTMVGYYPASYLITQYQLDDHLEMLGKIDQSVAGLIQEALQPL